MKYSEALHIYQQRHDCFPKKGSKGWDEIQEIMRSDEPAIMKAKKTLQKEKVKAFLKKYIRRPDTTGMSKVVLKGHHYWMHKPSGMMYFRDKITNRRENYAGIYNMTTKTLNDDLSEEEALEKFMKK